MVIFNGKRYSQLARKLADKMDMYDRQIDKGKDIFSMDEEFQELL